MLLIDKVKDDYKKAWFYVCETVENGWSRNMLLNGLGTDLYERQGHALTNFKRTLPEETSGLAQELTKDPLKVIHLPRGLAPVQGDVAAGEERSLTPREDKGIVMGLIGWDGVLG